MRPRLLVALLALSAFALSAVDTRDGSPFDPVRSAVGTVLSPVDRSVGGVAASAGEAVAAVGDLVDRSELERLREENDRLGRELTARRADARELADWRALLGTAEGAQLTVVPARAVGAGSALGFERTLTIDAGERDGVRAGAAVLAGPGLIGRTVEASPWTATVLLLDDPQFGVGARAATSGALGLLRGAGPGTLRWTQVDAGDVAHEVLLTSGSDTFPPGIPVGTVLSSGPSPDGLTTTAAVEPLADPRRVDVVGVVVPAPRGAPRAPLP